MEHLWPYHLKLRGAWKKGAAHARVELESNWQHWHAVDLAKWILKWVRRDVFVDGHLLPGTNYDRAAKLLVEVTGVKPKDPDPVYLDDDPFSN